MPLMRTLYGEEAGKQKAMELDAAIRKAIYGKAKEVGEDDRIRGEYVTFYSTIRSRGVADARAIVSIEMNHRPEELRREYEEAARDAAEDLGFRRDDVTVACVEDDCWIGWDNPTSSAA